MMDPRFPTALAGMLVALAACAARPRAKTPPPATRSERAEMGTLKVEISARSKILTMEERGGFQIGFKVTNEGGTTVDPKLYDSVLTVDGERCYAWDLAVQNGPRDRSWSALAPGASVHAAWRLGEAMFPRPGTYRVVLEFAGERSTVTVRVTP